MIKKITLYGILPLLLILLAVWGYCETTGSDHYNYQGYIVAIRNTDEGTVLTTLSGEKMAEFTVKWYTRQKFSGDLESLQEGAHIKLSTTRYSDINIKKFSAYDGFSMEGKIVFMENLTSPFLLTTNKLTQAYELYSLISPQEINYPLQTGNQVKVYYQYPLNAGNVNVVADVIQPLSDIIQPLTDEEITYITEQGYTVANH